MTAVPKDMPQTKSSSSSFFFGILIGAIIGAFIAIVIYRNNKGKVFADLQSKIKDIIQGFSGKENKSKTKAKTTNTNTDSDVVSAVKTIKKPKKFIKPKKRS